LEISEKAASIGLDKKDGGVFKNLADHALARMSTLADAQNLKHDGVNWWHWVRKNAMLFNASFRNRRAGIAATEAGSVMKHCDIATALRLESMDGHVLEDSGDDANARVLLVSGAYDREIVGENWWHWVRKKVTFQVQPLFVMEEATQSNLRFQYETRGKQKLYVQIIKNNSLTYEKRLASSGEAVELVDTVINLSPGDTLELSIETNGKASRLSERDARIAAWRVFNVTLTPGLT